MWKCRKQKNHFLQISRIRSKDISCDAHQKRKVSGTGFSCYKTISAENSKYKEISPSVSVITGLDEASNYYYGIGNTGRTYVISYDNTVTWYTIPDDEYYNAISSNTFLSATFT
ncbi:uncharacterized protein LOC118477373 [Aplysia californica]|uniref:Uncharacterized protein LOC118477373 n=1 Tax=Aplysia californica TaxID=6500 RepID=A0ABM1VQ86_APLCA|nr:uncharacterized protein LOC118477373 [Aplysia californica]